MPLSWLPLHPVYLQGEPHTQGAYSLSLLLAQVCGTDGNGYCLTAESLGTATPLTMLALNDTNHDLRWGVAGPC